MNHTDLIIFSGQSNMEGESERLPEINDPVSGAAEYRFLTDELVPLLHPVGEHIGKDGRACEIYPDNLSKTLEVSALLASSGGKANMVPFFCKGYVEATGRNVVAVHAAKGSTRIEVWQEGMYAYDMLCRKSLAAIRKVNPERVFFVWLQGESDAIAGHSKEYYKEKLTTLNQALREDLGVEKFGMIQVGRFVRDDRDLEIINAQREICAEHPDFLMLTDITWDLTEDPKYMNPNVAGHFGCHGFEVLGAAAAKGLADYVLSK